MNRYTATVYRPVTVIRWDLIAADICTAVVQPIARALVAIQHRITTIARHGAVAGIAISVGLVVGASIAIQTYQLLA